MAKFGFVVAPAVRFEDGYGPMVYTGGWNVELPHQCDAWEIANDLPFAEALAELNDFIAEAEAAREELIRRGTPA